MKTTLYVQDIECESCTRLVDRSIKTLHGINEYTIQKDSVIIDYDPSLIKEEAIIEAISSKGYAASKFPLSKMSFKRRFEDILKNKKKYAVERKMFLISLASFFSLLAIDLLAYFLLFRNQAGFFAATWQWFLYLDITVVSIAAAIWHLKAYKGAVTSMTGMMIGMTLGMQAGFMIGAVFGAVNGLFIGSMIGMISGVLLGVYGGKDTGIMGALQGMMSGLMGGTMGAMTTYMMMNDHVLLFMPAFMLINIAIMWGMSYMIYEEVVEDKKVQVVPTDFGTFFAYVFIFSIILAAIMIYAPKSILLIYS
jgi:copper chaperone CopZ